MPPLKLHVLAYVLTSSDDWWQVLAVDRKVFGEVAGAGDSKLSETMRERAERRQVVVWSSHANLIAIRWSSHGDHAAISSLLTVGSAHQAVSIDVHLAAAATYVPQRHRRVPAGAAALSKSSVRRHVMSHMHPVQGSRADHFYIVSSGELEMSVTPQDDVSVRVRRLGPGHHFG